MLNEPSGIELMLRKLFSKVETKTWYRTMTFGFYSRADDYTSNMQLNVHTFDEKMFNSIVNFCFNVKIFVGLLLYLSTTQDSFRDGPPTGKLENVLKYLSLFTAFVFLILKD